ncbi:hypothetical protein J3B02_000137 [Coemansia erecta]|uniref:Glycolipid transfer protein domain-containing protein n=1 Tax=Coemansia asiatica TaxID=1052880 RepID=A0A9W7XS99_9FUNG|nr:hypothetical protein LPJ64_000214 [Coemansia asiatica]KAJ2858547.1 hypothetical protein J3B02_000137 [Coemansia erecta]KAJ2889191.1 hypothetical protein FB639_000060 [Coemansia asiatica]
MPKFLDKVPFRFNDVTVTDAGINTDEFLRAAQGVVMLFDKLGSAAFLPVKSDIEGNINKVRTKFLISPLQFDTLEKIIYAEAGTKDRTATQGLLWLKRGLDFTAKGIARNIANSSEELSDSFTDAYAKTLKEFHNFIVKGVFNLAMKACPARNDFYAKLGGSYEDIVGDLRVWVDALQKLVDQLSEVYRKGAYDKGL